MEQKTPVLLVVLVETAQLRWFVAALGLEGQVIPLLRSAVGDLEKYLALSPNCSDREEMQKQLRALQHYIAGMN